jgi:hypothetical protein
VRRSSRGSALIEFALVLPFLMTIIFGTIDGARAFATMNRVKNAAHQGAEFAQYFPLRQAPSATMCAAPNNITDRAKQEGSDLIVTVTPAASPTCQDLTSTSTLHAGDTIKVTVSAPFTFVSPLARGLWKNTTIKSSVTITVQG